MQTPDSSHVSFCQSSVGFQWNQLNNKSAIIVQLHKQVVKNVNELLMFDHFSDEVLIKRIFIHFCSLLPACLSRASHCNTGSLSQRASIMTRLYLMLFTITMLLTRPLFYSHVKLFTSRAPLTNVVIFPVNQIIRYHHQPELWTTVDGFVQRIESSRIIINNSELHCISSNHK